MTRAYALLASLLLIATPLAGCTSSPEIEEIVDDILGCMDENAQNYDDNATAELLGDCIYLASMEIFMTAMTEQMEIDEMLEIIPQAGYSMSITMSEWNTDMNMQMDTVIEEMVMADLDTESVYVKMGMSIVPFLTSEYTQVQVGEIVNVHYISGGMMAGDGAGMGSYQTRDATPDVMETISSLVSVSDAGEAGGEMGLNLPTGDLSELSSDMPADAEPVISYDDESGVQTMTLEYTNDTGHDISIVTLIDDNEDLMSYEISTDNGSASSSISYTVMWGDAVVIEVDDTLPRTSIPINFHVEGMPEDNWDEGGDDIFYCDNGNEISRNLVDDGWDDCGDGSDESDDDENEPPTPEEAMAQVDTDGDGYMSYQEFQDAWESDPSNPDWDEVSYLLDDCDYDGNDLIDIDEMQCVIDGIVLLVSDGDGDDPDPEQMMDYMDTDDDGYLSLQELIDFLNNDREQNGEEPMSSEEEEGTANWFYSGDTDGDDLLSLEEFTQLLESSGDDDDNGDDDGDGEGGNDEPSRVTMMVMGQTLNAPISDFEVRFLVDCGEPDEEGNEPPISDCTIAASNGLTEGSATVDPAIAEYEFTYEYLDYDGDGLISDMDTLVIDNLMPGVQVELYDTWADQYTRESFATAEMLPGFGALMALTVLLGAAFATRRD